MKYGFIAFAAALTVLFSGAAHAASVSYNGYQFQAFVQQSGGKYYREFYENYQTKLKVGPNEEYTIIIKNPLPVRVAVAVSIDGLNSIDGKRTSLKNARKWLIEPYSSITIAGWQTSMKTLRKFIFTDQSASFAQWKEDRDGKKFTKNLGVIGVAWFWNANELYQALNPPQPFEDEKTKKDDVLRSRTSEKPTSGASAETKAGTGMGNQQQNHVTEVEFDENAGMYSLRDVMKIYYEFAKESPVPLPFVDEDENDGRFTPDMNK